MPGHLTLVADTDQPVPAPNRGRAFTPVADPVREAAITAANTLEAHADCADHVEAAIDHIRANHGTLTAILTGLWRAGAVYGHTARHDEQTEHDLADDLATVIALHDRTGGGSA